MSQNPGENPDPAKPFEPPVDEDPELVSMDAAHQSLADALRITFRLLVIIMFLLAALFVGSGLQTVGESQRGVKLFFGQASNREVTPGYTFAAPFPLGEVMRVSIGEQRLDLKEQFGPAVPSGPMRSTEIAALAPQSPKLRPDEHGSVLTGDNALAHTWWTVIWRHDASRVYQNLRNINPEQEERIVRAAVERGVVRAVAETTIDDLLKQSGAGAGESSLSLRVRELAQQTLDALDSGIIVDRVILDDKTPPARVAGAFQAVTSAESRAAQAREEAEQEARTILNSVAGEASRLVVDLIDEYEAALELENPSDAEAVLAEIDRILDGERIDMNGRPIRVSGEVTSIINAAKQYRTNVVARARSRATEFNVKLANFRASPNYFVANEWTPAYERFLRQTAAETFMLPGGADLEIVLNRDPDIAEEAETARNRRQVEEAMAERDAEQARAFREKQREARERRRERENQ